MQRLEYAVVVDVLPNSSRIKPSNCIAILEDIRVFGMPPMTRRFVVVKGAVRSRDESEKNTRSESSAQEWSYMFFFED